MRRWARRLGLGVLALVVALTVASFAYNLVTRHRDVPVSQLYSGPTVVVDGTRLAYEHWGARGTPVVLLGGFVEPAWIWTRAARVLARDHRVFAVDLPPFGYSQRRGPYTVAHWADLVRGFEQRLGLHRPVVVGHSLGAAVAVSVAADAAGIVLLDGDALPAGSGAGWLSHVLQPPWYTSLYRLVTGSDFVFRRVLHNAWGKQPPPLDDRVLDAWQRPFRVAGTAAAFRSMLRYGIQGVSEQTLRAVRTPRVVVWGADDSVDAPDAGRRTAALLHARFVSIPAAGHLSMLAAPRAVAAAIDDFARRAGS